jgi:hypothetical protein
MKPCILLIPVNDPGIFKKIHPTTVPIMIASKRNPPRPKGSRIVIQKFLFAKYQVCLHKGTPGAFTGGGGGAWVGAIVPAEEVSWERVQLWRRFVTRELEAVSRAGVRASTVEMSMRWSAGLTCGGQGRNWASKYVRTEDTGPVYTVCPLESSVI